MTATILDGKATAAAIRADLTGRVAKLAQAGITPGLGTVLVGDDPGSRSYVNGKHRDCAQVGIVSIRRDLPADATQQQVEDAVARAERRPGLHRLHRPAAAARRPRRRSAVLDLIDPAKDADGLHPVNLGKLVLGEPGAAAVHAAAASSNCCAAYDVPIAGRRRHRRSAAASPSAGRSACC